MAETRLFPALEGDELRRRLTDNADGIDEGPYTRRLTEEEIVLTKDRLAERTLDLFDLEEHKKEVVADFKEKIDPVKAEIGLHLRAIRTGVEERRGTLYKFVNHEAGMVDFYDDRGELISSRRVRPEERQATILPLGRTA